MDGECGPEGAEVDVNDFFHRPSVTPGQGPGHGNAVPAGEFKDQAVACLEVGGPEVERGVRVVAQGVGAGLIKKEIGRCRVKKKGKVLLENFQELWPVGLGGEFD